MERITIDSSSVLASNATGTVTVIRPIRIGGVTLGDKVVLPKGVMIGNTSIGSLIDKKLEARKENGVLIITGYHG